ncbi:MFS transporter [Phytomonospora endophytica]|uniref:MFS family permease n=1 Tax=Phytomonospora endophytica TaxID=714109 RepID=A0A841F6P3_9ACTN|nr:MFS transporter [Phytomonospora endophytica]MBB6032621.1 MFS family permease [Phytomonospora endophytica]GIG66229.1 MFS transporter [Phytomonospora endophytica]
MTPVTAPVVPLRRNRDFQLLWSGRAVAGLGQEVAGIAYPLLMLALTGSAGYAGLLATGQIAIQVLVTLPAGLLADRVNRRTIMIVSDLSRAVILGGVALAVYGGWATIPLIIGSAVLSSLFHGIFNPASTAALKQLVPAAQITSAQAQNEARMRATGLIGPPIGGWLFGIARSVPFLFDAITYLLAGLALLFIRKPLQAPRESAPAVREPAWRSATAGIRYLFAKPMLRNLLLWSMGINLALGGFFLVEIATWRERGASESTVGILAAIGTLGGLSGALLAPAIIKRVKPTHLVVGLAWALPVLMMSMGLLPGVYPLAVVAALVGFFLPALNSVGWAYIASGTPDELQGRVGAGATFLSMLISPIAPVALGTLFDAWGATAAFAVMAAVALLAALFTLTRPVRNLPRPEEVAVA